MIFAALDNIHPAAQPNVSAVYGKLSPGRQRWPIPWYESDGGGPRRDQFRPQTNTKEFTLLCRDARAKGCQGLLAIHWRSRDVEEVAAWCAQYAWEPDLSYEAFYRRFAARCFGPEHAEELGTVLRELESLGPRWTGASELLAAQPASVAFTEASNRILLARVGHIDPIEIAHTSGSRYSRLIAATHSVGAVSSI